jgi:type II secretory pathway predicted ATPase ExeA
MRRPAIATVPSTTPLTDAAPNAAPFPYRDYSAAKAEIENAIGRGVFYALVIGASGSGKTSLERDLASQEHRQYRFLYLSAPRVSLLSVTRYFAQLLRVQPRRSSLETMKAIVDDVKAQPTQLIAWIDEAASLPVATLTELRSLAEFNTDLPQVFSVVLAGPPELKSIVDAPSLVALKRRITVHCLLEGLRRDELDPFLVHRFGTADSRRVMAGIKDELFERTKSVPANIDKVLRHALRLAGKGPVDEAHLKEALDVAGL